MENKLDFIHTLKLRNLHPFYIQNPNKIFFESDFRQYQNKALYKGLLSSVQDKVDNEDEYLNEILEIQKVNSFETLLKIINHSVKKISSIVGSKDVNLFVETRRDEVNEPIYTIKKEEVNDLKILGDNVAQRRYTYGIDVNPESYLSDYVEQFQISFYLDERNKMVSGSMTLNWGNYLKNNANFNDVTKKVFINSMCRFFFENEVKKNSMMNMIHLFDDLKIKIENNKVSIESKMKKNWNNYIGRKLIDSNNQLAFTQDYSDNLFNSLFVSQIIMLIIYEDLKAYFKSKDPALFISLLDDHLKSGNVREITDSNRDFANLFKYVKNKYIYFSDIDLDDIETADDAIEVITNVAKYEEQSLWTSVPSYEIIRRSETPFFDDNDDLFQNDKNFKLLFLLTMYPQLFGLEVTNSNFSTYAEVLNLFEKIDFTDFEIDYDVKHKANSLVCERNYDYITFINNALSFLIVKNDNPVNLNKNISLKDEDEYVKDPNLKLADNYIWAIIFSQNRMWRLYEIESLTKQYKENAPSRLRSYLNELNALQYDDSHNFYGLVEIKKIVEKIDSSIAFKNSSKNFLHKLNNDDQRYGKSKERKYLTIGVLAAAVFGILDFFTAVFTILTVQPENIDGSLRDPRNMVIIAIGAVLAFVLICLLAYAAISRFLEKRHGNKKK
ncbi:MPN337 family protein [[Mycoplasma] testudinis]|uniref:MPN337 family protein n=1 Tax=[Mycoplasma] testudinis TaxID=33924 RepID=UPI0004833C9E|nr:hypothetical protein [[Mycoplasma] testudinis]